MSVKLFLLLALGLLVIPVIVMADGQESTIWIVKDSSYISPNPAGLNQTVQLRIAIANLYENETVCTFRASAEDNASIYPSGEFNVTVLANGHGDYYMGRGYCLSFFRFTLTANYTGTYPITVELWHEGRQIDFFSDTLQAVEGYPVFFPYELRVALVYLVALSTVGLVYIKVFYEEGHFGGDFKRMSKTDRRILLSSRRFYFPVAILSYMLGVVTLVALTYYFQGFSVLLSQSVGRMELTLAFTFIFSFVSLILMKGRLDASLKLANVIVILVTIPIVLDWFILPTIPTDNTLWGRIVWQLIEIALGIVIGTIVGLIFKRKEAT